MPEWEWTQWTERQITNRDIGLTKLSVLFPRVEGEWRCCCCFTNTWKLRLNMIQMTSKCQYKAASDSFLLRQTHAQSGEHRPVITSRSKHFRFDDTEGDESLTFFCSKPHINAFNRILLVWCQTWQFVPVGWWSSDLLFAGWGVKRGDVKKSRGRLAKQFCGHSLTSKEGFSD